MTIEERAQAIVMRAWLFAGKSNQLTQLYEVAEMHLREVSMEAWKEGFDDGSGAGINATRKQTTAPMFGDT